jgi:hypothetical protein
MALALVAAFSPALAQQGERRDESAAVPVRYAEGTVQLPRVAYRNRHAPRERRPPSGPSGPRDPESDRFSFLGRLRLRGGRHVHPAWCLHDKDGEEKEYSGRLDLPPDVYNGMVITIAKNLVKGDTQTVHIVAFTPKPRLIGLEIAPSTSERIKFGRHSETAVHFKLKPKLGVLVKVFATLLGKAPPDSDTWIVTDDVPAFVRFEGPLYSGPVWRLDLTSPSWPR